MQRLGGSRSSLASAATRSILNRLPEDTVRAIQEYKVCIKGRCLRVGSPLGLDAILAKELDLFAHVQPIRHLESLPSPMKAPQALDILIFRENTEDVLCELEWKKGSTEAKQVINFVNQDLARALDKQIRPDSSVGIKPISATATKRLIRLAIEYGIKNKRRSLTFVHEGATMRCTEGLFRDWGYELARKEFGEYTVTEQDVRENHGGTPPRGLLLVRDRQASEMFQELLIRPQDFDLVATKLNGLFLESMALAQSVRSLAIERVQRREGGGVSVDSMPPPAREPEDENPISTLLCGVLLFDHSVEGFRGARHALARQDAERRWRNARSRPTPRRSYGSFCDGFLRGDHRELRGSPKVACPPSDQAGCLRGRIVTHPLPPSLRPRSFSRGLLWKRTAVRNPWTQRTTRNKRYEEAKNWAPRLGPDRWHLALLAGQRELGDVILRHPAAEGTAKGKALDIQQMATVERLIVVSRYVELRRSCRSRCRSSPRAFRESRACRAKTCSTPT